MKQIVIMPGGFHPFHAGHAALYKSAVEAFNDADVYVAATNDTKTRPFPFSIKEKLAKLAGVADKHFVQVKSPFKAEEITQHYNPEEDVLIFVRSEKDKNEQPKPGGTKKDGSPAYFQPWTGKNLQPFNKHAYIAYLPTVEFGPGITSATEIRNAWPTLNNKRKTAMVMSLYPVTQKNPKLAANVVKMLDMGMGNELAEGWKDAVAGGAMALGALGAGAQTMPDINVQQVELANKYYNVLVQRAKEDGIKLDTRTLNVIKAKAQDAAAKKTQQSTPQQGFPSQGSERRVSKDASKFESEGVAEAINKVEPISKSVPIQKTVIHPVKQHMHSPPEKKTTPAVVNHIKPREVKEFAPPSSDDNSGGDSRSRRIRKLLEIAIQVAKEKNVDELGMIHAMNMIAGDEFFNTAVEGILPDITDKEYMFVLQSAYKTVKQGLAEGEEINEGPFVQRIMHPKKVSIYLKLGKGSKLVATDIPYEILDGYVKKVIQKYPQFKPTDFSFKSSDKVTENLGIPYPTTYEQENNKFKRRGPMRITNMTEFAPPGSNDREPDEEEILRQLAAQWWNGSIQQMKKAQQTLQAMGWDIGQDESGDDDAGVFVIRIGDVNGDSYIAFPHSELGLNEDYLNEI
jgi:hypothetical protein